MGEKPIFESKENIRIILKIESYQVVLDVLESPGKSEIEKANEKVSMSQNT